MADVTGRRTPLVVGVTVAMALAMAACGSSSTDPDLGSAGQISPIKDRVGAPDLSAGIIGGGSLNLAALKGHVVVLNIFGSWCPPCQAEQPGLSSLSDAMQSAGVRFVGIAERDNDGAVESYQRTYQVKYPAIEDETGSLVAKFRAIPVSGIPSTLVIDKQGREAARFIAPVETSALKPVLTALNAEPT